MKASIIVLGLLFTVEFIQGQLGCMFTVQRPPKITALIRQLLSERSTATNCQQSFSLQDGGCDWPRMCLLMSPYALWYFSAIRALVIPASPFNYPNQVHIGFLPKWGENTLLPWSKYRPEVLIIIKGTCDLVLYLVLYTGK